MFTSEEYSWSDIEMTMLGRVVIGFRKISYTEKQTKTNIYARGNKPVARTRGNKEYEGSVMLLQSEVESLQAELAAGKSLNDIGPFDITVSYAPASGNIKTDILKACEFTEITKGMSQGDSNMEIELPIIIGDIDYNV